MKLRSLFLVLIIGFVSLPFVSRAQDDDRLFERMALSGDVKAQTVVGLRCTDLVQSYAWLSVASGTGNDTYGWFSVGGGHENKPATRALSIIREKMSQEQIEEGRQLAGKLYQKIKQNQTVERQQLDQEIRQAQMAALRKARQEKFVSGGEAQASYVQKALNGDAEAQTAVGRLCPDLVKAYAWLSLAAGQGDETAIKSFSVVQKQMPPERVEKGRQLAQKIEQEIKQNQMAALQKAEQEKMVALQKAEQEKELERAVAESVKEIEKQEQVAALQKAEREKEAARVLAERAKEIEEQEKAAALQREKQAAIQQQQMERQQRKEKMGVWVRGVIKTLIMCAISYAAYHMRWSNVAKIGLGPVIVIFMGVCSMGRGVIGFETEKQVDTMIVTRGWLRAAIEKKPEVEYKPIYQQCEADAKDRVGQFIFGVCLTIGGRVWAGKRLDTAQKNSVPE